MKISEYVKPELDYILENANFTNDEEEVFKLLARGKTIIEISLEVGLSESAVNRRIRKIRQKITRL